MEKTGFLDIEVAREHVQLRRAGLSASGVFERLAEPGTVALKARYPAVKDVGEIASVIGPEPVAHGAECADQNRGAGGVMRRGDLGGDKPRLDQQAERRFGSVDAFWKVIHRILHPVVGATDGRADPARWKDHSRRASDQTSQAKRGDT